MSHYGTGWLETEALLAAEEGNDDVLYEMVVPMLPFERDALRAACHKLIQVLRDAPYSDEM